MKALQEVAKQVAEVSGGVTAFQTIPLSHITSSTQQKPPEQQQRIGGQARPPLVVHAFQLFKIICTECNCMIVDCSQAVTAIALHARKIENLQDMRAKLSCACGSFALL